MTKSAPNALVEIGAVLLLRNDGAALMQLRDNLPGLRRAGEWVPPGGHRDPGESIEVCAHREFFEETGYQCNKLYPLGDVLDAPGDPWPDYRLAMFWAPYDETQSLHCYEGQELRFIARQDATSHNVETFFLEMWDRALASLATKAP